MEFILKYQEHLIYLASVIAIVGILRFLTNFFYKKLVKKAKEKYPRESEGALLRVKRVLNILWILLGFIALAFLWAEKSEYADLTANFNLLIYLGVVTVVTVILGSATNMWFQHLVRKRQLNQLDITSLRFSRYAVVAIVYFIGILLALYAFPAFRGVAQTALGSAGVIAVIAGIASQEALANVISGIFIISFKPFKIGDIIELTGTKVGKVVDITLRHTVIQNFDNRMIIIPNAIINKETLINASMREKKCCERLEIGISYNSDVELAKKIMREECENHPLILDNRTTAEKKQNVPIVKTALISLNDSSVTIRAWAWVSNYDAVYELKWGVLETIKKRFAKEGIEIPFPNQTITLRREKKYEDLVS